ncbi:hypothetical protein SCYAM73S_04108 [Streptomyces cyaneofuscatus]
MQVTITRRAHCGTRIYGQAPAQACQPPPWCAARLMPVTPPSVAFPVRLARSVGPAGDLDSFYRFPRGGVAAEGFASARASRPATPPGACGSGRFYGGMDQEDAGPGWDSLGWSISFPVTAVLVYVLSRMWAGERVPHHGEGVGLVTRAPNMSLHGLCGPRPRYPAGVGAVSACPRRTKVPACPGGSGPSSCWCRRRGDRGLLLWRTGQGQGRVRASSWAARSGWAAARWGRVATSGAMMSAGLSWARAADVSRRSPCCRSRRQWRSCGAWRARRLGCGATPLGTIQSRL